MLFSGTMKRKITIRSLNNERQIINNGKDLIFDQGARGGTAHDP